MLIEQLHPIWRELLSNQLSFLQGVETRLSAGVETVPQPSQILRALSYSPDDQRVLLLGQDPYPNPKYATGLCFATPQGATPPPMSLRNILAEIRADLALVDSITPNLETWADRGVLMLNRHLTTAPGVSGAQASWGWRQFTDAVIENWVEWRSHRAVAILWGKSAQSVRPLLKTLPVIASAHPSPLSAHRGFFGSRPFSRCNQELAKFQLPTIDWI
jgi:uracil-DNA glycosylase